MPKKIIDHFEFSTEELSQFGLGQLESIQFLEKQMKLIEAEITMHETAKAIFQELLKHKNI